MFWNRFVISDQFDLIYDGCIDSSFVPLINYNFYVEMALSGCKHLCETVHDVTCTMLTFVPEQRSCILHPLQNIPRLDDHPDCIFAEVYHRHRRVGMYVEIVWHINVCRNRKCKTPYACVALTLWSYCLRRTPHDVMHLWGSGRWQVHIWAK